MWSRRIQPLFDSICETTFRLLKRHTSTEKVTWWTSWRSKLEYQQPDKTKSKTPSLSLRNKKLTISLSKKRKLIYGVKSARKTLKVNTTYTFTWRAKAIALELLRSNGYTRSPNQRSSLLIRNRKLEKALMRPE
jgi:hypothetical protein